MNDQKKESWHKRVARQKKGAILDAATRLFLATGYDGTTLEAIAKGAEVSTGTLFKYFPSKAELFGGIMERAWAPDEFDPSAEEPDNRSQTLESIGLNYADRLADDDVVALFRVIIAEANRFPELGQALYERGKAPYLARLDAYLGKEVSEGRMTMPEDQRSLAAREFLGMINDQLFWPRLLLASERPSQKDTQTVVASACETFRSRYACRS